MNALRYSEKDHTFGHREAAHAWEAHLAIEAFALHDDDYEACHRTLEDRINAWVKSGRAASRLLEADELRVVRHWLNRDSARTLAAREDLQTLLSSSEAALAAHAARAAATEEARRHRRMRQWMIVALVMMTVAAIAVSTLG